jgi:hypothetical protein
MDRFQQKNSLFIKLGALFGPLLKIVENPDQYDEQKKSETIARYFAEYSLLVKEFRYFASGHPGHFYLIEFSKFQGALEGLQRKLLSNAALVEAIKEQFTAAQAALDAISVPRTSVILEAGSPFTAYCKLKELCEADATSSLVWLDPFLSASIFHRFLSSVRATVPVTLVTREPATQAGKRDQARWTEFIDISRLYGQERGPALYRLIIQPNLHDWWIIFDEKRIYGLGGSAKDAGDKDYFTIASVEATSENLQKIQTHIDSGTELFGPTTPHHL